MTLQDKVSLSLMDSPDKSILSDNEPSEAELIERNPVKRKRGRIIGWSLAGVIALAAGVTWTQRIGIAERFIAGELESRGVRATYEVDRVGFRTQRLRNLVIGDPQRPDLVADEVTVLIDLLGGPEVTGVHARGVRLFGRFEDGRLRLGELDKFTDASRRKPLGLPDIDLRLADARMKLATPWGNAGLRLDGAGNVRSGFRGKLAMVSPQVEAFGCRLTAVNAWVDLNVVARRPSVDGPLTINRMRCDDGRVRIARPEFDVDATFTELLQVDKAGFDARTGAIEVRGNRLASASGKLAITNNAETIGVGFDLSGVGLATPWVVSRRVRTEGTLAAAKVRGSKDPLVFEGDIALNGARANAATRRSIEGFSKTGSGTPFGPLLAAMASAAGRAAGDFDGRSKVLFGRQRLGQRLILSDLSAQSASGAKILLDDGDGLIVDPRGGGWRIDGLARIGGGGLPNGTLRLNQAAIGDPLSGEARFARYEAGGSVLDLTPVRFGPARGGGTRFDTMMTLSGPFSGVQVADLRMPVAGTISPRGRVAIAGGCTDLGYRSIRIDKFVTQPGRFRLCAPGGQPLLAFGAGALTGGAVLLGPVIRGRIGNSPIAIDARRFAFGLTRRDFTGNDVVVVLGRPDAPVRMRFATLNGRFVPGAIVGTIGDGIGKIGNVPIDLAEIAGAWRFAKGRLTVDGAMRASDAVGGDDGTPRFEPMIVRDVDFALEGDTIDADGVLVEPRSARDIGTVVIAHRLSSGTGTADLAFPSLTFDRGFQPARLTRRALGVVANVRGVVTGEGQIRWTKDGVASDGVFRTANLDFAAPFGPVKGFATEVRFTDLLGLVSAPGQRATLASVNPGIEVTDGAVAYQLLPEGRIGVEGAEWPFVGGTLALRPTVLDFGEGKAKTLTFDIRGFDAARFISQFEIPNVTARGIFDGQMPMVFDQSGGRVDNGLLISRPPGGEISYNGEFPKDMGFVQKLALGVVKSIEFEKLSIGIDGPLDGEMVSDIRFEGLAQGPSADRNFLTRAIAKIPFELNIKLTGPFRQLIFTARSMRDPKLLIERNLPALIRAQEAAEQRTAQQPGGAASQPPEPGAVQPPSTEEKP